MKLFNVLGCLKMACGIFRWVAIGVTSAENPLITKMTRKLMLLSQIPKTQTTLIDSLATINPAANIPFFLHEKEPR